MYRLRLRLGNVLNHTLLSKRLCEVPGHMEEEFVPTTSSVQLHVYLRRGVGRTNVKVPRSPGQKGRAYPSISPFLTNPDRASKATLHLTDTYDP